MAARRVSGHGVEDLVGRQSRRGGCRRTAIESDRRHDDSVDKVIADSLAALRRRRQVVGVGAELGHEAEVRRDDIEMRRAARRRHEVQ